MPLGAIHAVNYGVYFAGRHGGRQQSSRERDAWQQKMDGVNRDLMPLASGVGVRGQIAGDLCVS